MTQRYWDLFKRSIKGPHQINEAKGEIEFIEQKIILNIHNFLHTTTYHDVVIVDDPDQLVYQHYKSGLVPTWSVSFSTYGDSVSAYHETARDRNFEGSIERHVGFRFEFLVAKQTRQINIISSVIDTWPS